VCIHGHFYQPPRENAWLEAIELQDSAAPFHDWNERITAECYAPNAAARILDGEGRIAQIVNNYPNMSFNFGPTLLSWMDDASPDTYQAILEADRESQRRFSGHGSALAQAYNHMIMPLATRRDKHTQVIWGIRDFERRFGRFPEGMWLPETAVDVETLDILAEHGLRFTVLAPHQARRIRPLTGGEWQDVSGGHIDPTRAYHANLPSGRSIALFFYDGPISRAVAFEGLLSSGERFVDRLVGGFSDARGWPQLMHIATDGETYGHHQPHGDMALAYALDAIESRGLAKITNYGEFLELQRPTHEVEIIPNTSWSCAHGVERWRGDCGCNSGGHGGWNQSWRGPLREALDRLRDTVGPLYEARARDLLQDPWWARDEFVDVVLDRSPESVDRFLEQHGRRSLTESEQIVTLKLLELQRHAMHMYTSCGWFFDEISGIETVQVIQYASRVVQLAQDLFGDGLEARFVEKLAAARSNIRDLENGARVYTKLVKPAQVDLLRVAAHYAVSSLFEDYKESQRLYSYQVDRQEYRTWAAGVARAAVGRALVTSQVTREKLPVAFGMVHLGDHNVSAGVREFRREDGFGALARDVGEAFARADLAEVIRTLDRKFDGASYSVRSLFRDEQRKVLEPILETALESAEATFRQIYELHAPLLLFLNDQGMPLPRPLLAAAASVLVRDLRRLLAVEPPDPSAVSAVLEQASLVGFVLEANTLQRSVKEIARRIVDRLRSMPVGLSDFEEIEAELDVVQMMPFRVDLWEVQNAFFEFIERSDQFLKRSETFLQHQEELVAARAKRDGEIHAWKERMASLGAKLGVRTPQ
jgi:alpha-amylase/alpha-mannosidase (GH57 family)